MKTKHSDTRKEMERLMSRFMDGLTTLDEEERLARYFRQADIPEEWNAWREMFAYFDEGMPTGGACGTHKRRRTRLTAMWAGIAAAAAVALAVVMTMPHPADTLPDTAQLAPVAPADTVTATPGEAADDSTGTQDAPQRPTRRRSYYKHKYEPAPPKTYYAEAAPQADAEAMAEADRLVEEQLNMMELTQQAMMLTNEAKAKTDNPQALLATNDDADDFQEAN